MPAISQEQWRRGVLVTVALVLLGIWVDLIGYGTAFLDPASTGRDMEVNRYAYQAGRLAIAAAMIGAPALFERSRVVKVALSVGMALMTAVLAGAPYQTVVPAPWASAVASFFLCAAYTWATAAFYVELATGLPIAWAIGVMAVAQIAEQLSSLALNHALPHGVQIAVCVAVPLAVLGLMLRCDRSPCLPVRGPEVTGQAKRHVLILVGAAGVAVMVMGAVSDVGIWGNLRASYVASSFHESVTTVLVACAVMAALVACALLRFTDAPFSYRYQVPFLVIIAGCMLALARDIYPGFASRVETVVLSGIEYYAHVLAWTVCVAAIQVVRTPAYRCAGIVSAGGGVASMAWVVLLENNRPVAGLVVLALIYGFIILTAVHPRIMYERSSAQVTTREELNEYAIDGEQEIPLGVNGVVAKGAVEERSTVMAQKFGLSPREREVLALLVQGRTVAAICQKLQLSEGTVKTHIAHIYDKTGVHARQDLLDLAYGPQIKL